VTHLRDGTIVRRPESGPLGGALIGRSASCPSRARPAWPR
jgi:hypothetical protein